MIHLAWLAHGAMGDSLVPMSAEKSGPALHSVGTLVYSTLSFFDSETNKLGLEPKREKF